MDLEDLRKNWDAFGRTMPMRSILWRQEPWEPEEFFESGRVQVAATLDRLRVLGVRPGGRALDFGCGIGRLTQALAAHFDEVVGVDVAASMIDLAERHNRFPGRCHYRINFRDDLSQFESESFDFVYSLIALQHVGSDLARRYVEEFMRLLRPDGVAVFQLPSHFLAPVPLGPEAMVAELSAVRDGVACSEAIEVLPGASIRLAVQVRNRSGQPWTPEHRVACGGQWFRADEEPALDDQGPWNPLGSTLGAGERADLTVDAAAPTFPGRYRLRLTLWQSGGAPFPEDGLDPLTVDVVVSAVRGTADGPEPAGAADDQEPAGTAHLLMQAVAREEVLASVERLGGEVLATDDDALAGPDWRSYLYVVRKRGSFVQRAGNAWPRFLRRAWALTSVLR